MLKVLRRGSARYLLLSAVVLSVLVCVYYVNYGSGLTTKNLVAKLARKTEGGEPPPALVGGATPRSVRGDLGDPAEEWVEGDTTVTTDNCPVVAQASTDVNTVDQFKQFEFQPYWMKSREYWDTSFEERYKQRKTKWPQLPLKVIVVPHSHNDPGWLKTYESYFHYQTRQILNNMVDKLQQFRNMTFIWTEISFFAEWWESAHPTKRRVVKKLLEEGRLEIPTGGWVMTDEATVHVYAMLDQLIEGHQWLKNNLGISPKSGWAVDPFGHGSTVVYLLKSCGISGTIIQRIHYAWKQWLAEQQMGDFLWRQNWDSTGKTDLLVHNQPFDIYSIKHSCGPHPQVCLNFDFRKIPGEYTEYSVKAVPIDARNVKEKAELLLEQYGRTGSLFPHNVVMMPLGDDFRYDHDVEWDQQYKSYKKLFDFINQNKHYNAEIKFGTPSEYFKAVRERMRALQTLRGDFFVYSDIFSEGRPAYWSGYFTTRPYWKILDRELEASLRSAEILYTLALNRARQQGFNKTLQILERDYEKMARARQSLGLFQHHDAITGTSKSFVMHDYALKMFEGIQDTVSIQCRSAQALMSKDLRVMQVGGKMKQQLVTFLLPDTDRESYEKLPRKIPLVVPRNEPRRVVLFNSLAQHRQDVVRLRVQSPNIRVLDSDGNEIPFQVNPVWNKTEKSLQMIRDEFEVMFVADLPPLSLVTFVLERVAEKNLDIRAVVYCSNCAKSDDPSFVSPFEVKGMQAGDIQLENHKMKLLFDGHTGFLKAITKKSTGKTTQCGLQFAAYPSAQFHSGAYLFMPDPNSREPEREVLQDGTQEIFITSGPIASELAVMYDRVLAHSVRIYHVAGPLSEGIYMENQVDFDTPPKYRETELFMRFVTDISNGDVPEFYSDLNGFQMQRRVKVERIGIEGNYYPLTTMAYIQDTARRLSLLVNHAQGAASWQPGWLEVMLDRRTLYDDSRGMGEGVVDNKKTLSKFWLLLEEQSGVSEQFSRPSLFAHHLSNSLLYPSNLYVVEGIDSQAIHPRVNLLSKSFPCDTHLLNLRTVADPLYTQFPTSSAFMVLHKQGFSCDVGSQLPQCGLEPGALHKKTVFRDVQLGFITHTSLTGLHSIETFKTLDDVQLQPMELLTLNLTFVL